MNGERCVNSSSQLGQITVCQSTQPPSSTSSAGSKPATLLTPDLLLLTAGTHANIKNIKKLILPVVTYSLTSSSSSISAGVGRTGCFIVIDAMLERIRHERTVDIYGHVTLMRSQRNYMVQTEDQYSFIHEALLEAVACGNTEVAARSLYSYMQKLSKVESGEHVTGMELEFKVA